MKPVLNFTIEELGPPDFEIVAREVLALYAELGDEARDLGALDEKRVRELWWQRPGKMRAFGARDRKGTLLGIMTLTEGFALYANGYYGVIPEMYVRPDSRSLGIGAAFIAEARAIGRDRGWSRIEVTGPEAGTQRTVSFYLRHGFTHAGPKLKLPL